MVAALLTGSVETGGFGAGAVCCTARTGLRAGFGFAVAACFCAGASTVTGGSDCCCVCGVAVCAPAAEAK
ncbi:MAG: hypothetical protein WBD95_19045, partial [Xanthobacteraceae bacterium]